MRVRMDDENEFEECRKLFYFIFFLTMYVNYVILFKRCLKLYSNFKGKFLCYTKFKVSSRRAPKMTSTMLSLWCKL